jgi:hypothetical protein
LPYSKKQQEERGTEEVTEFLYEKMYVRCVEDSKTSRNMCEDLLGYSHKQAKY